MCNSLKNRVYATLVVYLFFCFCSAWWVEFFWGGEGGSCGNYCQICGQELIKISMDYAGE